MSNANVVTSANREHRACILSMSHHIGAYILVLIRLLVPSVMNTESQAPVSPADSEATKVSAEIEAATLEAKANLQDKHRSALALRQIRSPSPEYVRSHHQGFNSVS